MRNDKEKFRKWAAKEQRKYEQWFSENSHRPKRKTRLDLPPRWHTVVRIALILTYWKGAAGVGGGSHNDHLKRLLFEYWPEIYPRYTLAWTSHVASALREIRINHKIFGNVPHMSRRKQTGSGYRQHRAFLISKENNSLLWSNRKNAYEGLQASIREIMAKQNTMINANTAMTEKDIPINLRDSLIESNVALELSIEAEIKVLKAIQDLAA